MYPRPRECPTAADPDGRRPGVRRDQGADPERRAAARVGLRQEALAVELGVSRTPLREGCAGWLLKGWSSSIRTVERRSQGRRRPTPVRAMRRGSCSSRGCASRAGRRPEAELARMWRAIDEERASESDAEAFAASRDFHLALVAAWETATCCALPSRWVTAIGQPSSTAGIARPSAPSHLTHPQPPSWSPLGSSFHRPSWRHLGHLRRPARPPLARRRDRPRHRQHARHGAPPRHRHLGAERGCDGHEDEAGPRHRRRGEADGGPHPGQHRRHSPAARRRDQRLRRHRADDPLLHPEGA